MNLRMMPPTLLVYFLMMQPSTANSIGRSTYVDGGPPTHKRHFSSLTHNPHLTENSREGGVGSNHVGGAPLLSSPPEGVVGSSKDDDGEDFDEPDLLNFPQFSKRQYDDYGHMRFGKRAESFDDYGHLRFGKRGSFEDYGHMRFGKRNTDNEEDDYGHLRFGRPGP